MKEIFEAYKPVKWIVLAGVILLGWLAYADYTGWRILSFNNQQQWGASGPNGHK